jgi:hypothetical protein
MFCGINLLRQILQHLGCATGCIGANGWACSIFCGINLLEQILQRLGCVTRSIRHGDTDSRCRCMIILSASSAIIQTLEILCYLKCAARNVPTRFLCVRTGNMLFYAVLQPLQPMNTARHSQ